MSAVFVVDALRTAVAPRNGAFKDIETCDLAAPLIRALAQRLRLEGIGCLEVILGNALYGGGNPARVVALAAGLGENVSAFTLDTQCCSGLDAIAFAAARIASGATDIAIAGGVESWSRSPLRFRRPKLRGEQPQEYARPPFTPWGDRDPDLLASAATLAAARGVSRQMQEAFAIASHRKARAAETCAELTTLAAIDRDTFTRVLDERTCARLAGVAGVKPFELTSATISVEADAAAIVVLASERALNALTPMHRPLRFAGHVTCGFDPAMPALAPCDAALRALHQAGIAAGAVSVVEIMEAFAVQAMAFVEDLRFDPAKVNRGGGALARGHPVGASGAILATRLFHELQKETQGSFGLAAIAAAGGLGSALLLQR